MAICLKRRDEFIGLLVPWYEMNWSNYFDLSDLQVKMKDTFEVKISFNSFEIILYIFRLIYVII
jgi:hypothetical protein